MADPTLPDDPRTTPGSPRESAWPLVLGVLVASLATAGALLARSGWGSAPEGAQGDDGFRGRVSVYCRHADGHVVLVDQTRECVTSATLEVKLFTDDPRVKLGGWMALGNGQVSAGDWTFDKAGVTVTIPLSQAQPGPLSVVGLFSDRALDVRNLYDYVTLAGDGPDAAWGHLQRLDRKVNTWRRGGTTVGLHSVTFRIRRG